jgi:hypothetical protein
VSSPGFLPEPVGVGTDGCNSDECCTPLTTIERDRDLHDAARWARLLSWVSLG